MVTYTLTNLPAYMSVTLHVRVLTKYYVGPPSNMLEFDTLEGGERSSVGGLYSLSFETGVLYLILRMGFVLIF